MLDKANKNAKLISSKQKFQSNNFSGKTVNEDEFLNRITQDFLDKVDVSRNDKNYF